MRSDKKDIRKVRMNNLLFGTTTVTTACLYYGLRLGNVLYHSEQEIGLFEAMASSVETIFSQPLALFPSDLGSVLIFLTVALIADIYMLNEYIILEGAIDDAQGDAAFEENFRQYDKEFCFDPKIALPIMGKKVNKRTTYMLDAKDDEEEHKKVIRQDMDLNRREKRRAERMLKNKKLTPELVEMYLLTFSKKYRAIYECRMQSQIYAQGLYLGLNGSWTQRNANAIVFGASGAGKSRFFLKPNILQANGCFIVTDPSGDIMQGLGGFLKLMGYTVKCFNVQDMTESCRFNPLYYVRKTTDIPIIVNTLIENTRGENVKPGGGDPFWDKATQSLLCAIIGYLFEVCPIEQRNFANVLEILNMAQIDEGATEFGDNDFDKLFKELGKADPSSYAYLNYKVFKQAPAKTALNVLISTGVLLSQYIGIHEFNNLTFKDELELDKIGDEKYALFLNIPQEDTTYSWITAMLYSTVFRLMYAKGNKRMKDEGLDNPELKIPVRFLIDECANVGKIPNLDKILATCRKYRLSVVPIFQNYSQVVQVYGKEIANNIISNCDTFVFLGGSDDETLKIVCNHLGKETVQTLSYGNSKGKMASTSVNKQSVGKELMSRINVEQMSNAMCLVFIRALKPFKVHKYKLEEHPNYRYTAEANKKYLFKNPFVLKYDDEEIEEIRVKRKGEDGYIKPKVVDSARKRALDIQMEKDHARKLHILEVWKKENPKGTIEEALKFLPLSPAELMELWAEGTPMKSYNVTPSEVQPSDQSMTEEREAKLQSETVPELQSTRLLENLKVENTTIIGAYAPAYEFDMVTDFKLPNPNEEKKENSTSSKEKSPSKDQTGKEANTEPEKEEDEGYISNWAREAEESADHAADMAEIMAEFANINFAEMVDITDDLG